jgi:molybdopterin/thiamine biosynthesis adenylyltransferase
MTLTPEERRRYTRQLSLPEIGARGQERLRAARVLVVGAGGLGSPAALYLAAAGVGELHIADGDRVEISNLQRQLLHATPDLGRPKVESAAEALRALNPHVAVVKHGVRIDRDNAAGLVEPVDFVVDATDNFAAKFLVADACHAAGRAYSHGGIDRSFGQTMTVVPGRSACYRCVFERPPAESPGPHAGPVGVLPGVIGTIQATEALKYLLGWGELLTDRLLSYDPRTMTFRCVALRRRPTCALCAGGCP